MRTLIVCLLCLQLINTFGQETATKERPDLGIDFIDGELIMKPSSSCMNQTCNTTVELLKKEITQTVIQKIRKSDLKTSFVFKTGHASFYFTVYHSPYNNLHTDTILHLENDSIMIHDVGADGLLTDSTKEYCINKHTLKHMDWKSSYALLIESGVCPFACFMEKMQALGYKGFILQFRKDGHSDIEYY